MVPVINRKQKLKCLIFLIFQLLKVYKENKHNVTMSCCTEHNNALDLVVASQRHWPGGLFQSHEVLKLCKNRQIHVLSHKSLTIIVFYCNILAGSNLWGKR